LVDNKALVLEVEILYRLLMIRDYLLIFFIQIYLFMIIWFVRAKRA
jgi:hypothetical protein